MARAGIFDLLIVDDPMIGRRGHIVLGKWSTIDDGDDKPARIPGSNVASYGELEGVIESLKRDLDGLLREAKRKFA
jgi:hypothetical protein